jgi:Holliday junction resolvase-like predicted endonuclease
LPKKVDSKKLIRDFKAAEKIAEDWLKSKGFDVLYCHEGKASNLPYDILAQKGSEKWVIDVKTGKNPSINLESFRKLLEKKIRNPKTKEFFKHNRIGYIFVIDEKPFLLGYNKYEWRARKAWTTREKTEAAQ